MAVIMRKDHAVVVKVPRNMLVCITVCDIMTIVAKPYVQLTEITETSVSLLDILFGIYERQ